MYTFFIIPLFSFILQGIDEVRFYNNLPRVGEVYNSLHDDVQTIIRNCRFGPFIEYILSFLRQNILRMLVRAGVSLIFFWDTTNTFHFPWGEMTITPFEFGVITGLRMTGRDLEIYHGQELDYSAFFGRAGRESEEFFPKNFPHTRLKEFLSDNRYLRHCNAEKQARLFLWYAFSAAIFSSSTDNATWRMYILWEIWAW